MIKKFIKEEKAVATIVEATIVFPVMFLVIIFMLFMGNAYYQMSRIDAIVAECAMEGAAACTDPFYYRVRDEVKKSGDAPISNNDIQPYRYVIGVNGNSGNIKEVRIKIEEKLTKAIKDTGFFGGMKPTITAHQVQYKSNFFYATFAVEVHYRITIPVRLLGERNFEILKSSARSEGAVNDPAECILNTDMVLDYIEGSKTGQKAIQKIQEAMGKVREFLNL